MHLCSCGPQGQQRSGMVRCFAVLWLAVAGLLFAQRWPFPITTLAQTPKSWQQVDLHIYLTKRRHLPTKK
eukprot:6461145-Amphidinium_carterae.1